MRPRDLLLAAALATPLLPLTACEAEPTEASLAPRAVDPSMVRWLGHGSWNVASGTVPSTWAEKGVWIDVEVENAAYDKVVGIVWTDDGWAHVYTDYLEYEASLDNNKERWGLDFAPLGRLDSYYIGGWTNYVTGTTRAGGTTVGIEYAVFYEVQGATYWDNNGGANFSLDLNLAP